MNQEQIFYLANTFSGILLPYLQNYIKKKFPFLDVKTANTLLAVCYSGLVGLVVTYATGKLNSVDIVASIGQVYLISQAYFKLKVKK